MLRTVLFICTSCLIASYAVEIPGIDPEQQEAAIKTGSLIWQVFKTERRVTNISHYLPHETIDNLYGSLGENIDEVTNYDTATSTRKEKMVLLKSNMYKFHQAAKEIDDRYEDFLIVSDPNKKEHFQTIEDFAQSTLKDNKGMKRIIRDLHFNLAGNGYENLIHLLNSSYEDIYQFCGTSTTKQSFFYQLLFSVTSYHHKSYAMLLYSNQIFRDRLNYTDFDERLNTLNNETQTRIEETIKMIEPVIAAASRDMHRCDLQKSHKEDETYTYLKNLYTRIFQHTKEIVRKRVDPDCLGECPVPEDILGVKCDGECEIKQRKCNKLVECDHAAEHDLCLEASQTSIRRYSSVKDHYSFWYKLWHIPGSGCNDKILIPDESACSMSSVCNCVCDESENSDRYFSLDDVRSDVESNYVVTGVKFVKKNGIVKLQIQEGKLLPFAFVDQKTVNWTSTGQHESYSTYDVDGNIKNLSDDFELISDDRRRHNVTWRTGRGIFLSNVDAPKDEMVTGVRLSTDHIGEEIFLKIELESTQFNFTTGQLNVTSSRWHTSHANDFQHLFKLDQYEAPINVDVSHPRDLLENTITHFTPTSIISKDTGSSVVPYLDIQPLNSKIAVPLSAMGLGLMSAERSGGYLVLSSKSFDVSPYMSLL